MISLFKLMHTLLLRGFVPALIFGDIIEVFTQILHALFYFYR